MAVCVVVGCWLLSFVVFVLIDCVCCLLFVGCCLLLFGELCVLLVVCCFLLFRVDVFVAGG